MTIKYIEMTVRLPLWSSIPEDERATEADLRAWHSYARTADEAVKLLRSPRCIIAIKNKQRRGLYTPCAHVLQPGADRCAYHGGPLANATKPASPPTKAELARQLEHARAELAVLRSGGVA